MIFNFPHVGGASSDGFSFFFFLLQCLSKKKKKNFLSLLSLIPFFPRCEEKSITVVGFFQILSFYSRFFFFSCVCNAPRHPFLPGWEREREGQGEEEGERKGKGEGGGREREIGGFLFSISLLLFFKSWDVPSLGVAADLVSFFVSSFLSSFSTLSYFPLILQTEIQRSNPI